MPSYNIFPICSPISSSQLTAYKTIRLASLQTDPQAFGSNYAREVAFTQDVWQERLDAPFKQTLIASVVDDALPLHGRGDQDKDDGEIANKPENRGEWIGTMSIVGPSGLIPSILAPFKEAGVGDNWATYAIFAMWVHPAHRGKGVGARLVKAGLEWAQADGVDPKADDDVEKVVVLLVKDGNVAGRALYSRLGFTKVPEVKAGEGETWMAVKIPKRFG